MKVLLIAANANMHRLFLFNHVRSFREAPLTLTTLAALDGRDDVEYRLVDESIDKVPLDADVDLVGISVLTGTSRRAYALADHFRRRGIPVVLGGIHVTLMPEEAARFADTIVVGMADQLWPQVLDDFAKGQLKPRYQEDADKPNKVLEGLPTPRWDLQRMSGYMVPHVVQVSRGCPYQCDFCTVPTVWKRFQLRPVADVIRDIQRVPAKRFVISDVNPFEDKEYSRELLTAMIPLKKTWGALATTRTARDPEMFELMRKAGCTYLLLGFESADQDNLDQISKSFNDAKGYGDLMRQCRAAHISIQGCFVFGFDHDTTDVFARTVDLVQELKVDIPRYSIYTPYPGTRLFKRLEAEGRMLSYDWADYDTMHVVYRPKLMSPVELYEGFRWAYKETFRLNKILGRTVGSGRLFPINFIGNLAYRLFARRLMQGKGFDMPVDGPLREAQRPPESSPERSPLQLAGE